MIIETLTKNVANSKELLRRVMPHLAGERDCSCASALKSAIITPPERVSDEVKRKLAPIVGKYMS